MPDLRQFRQFIAVAEEMNFKRAAERLHMAQPPLTTAIKKLEEELGVMLIERANRIQRLTDAGQAFLLEARRSIEQAERAVLVARQAGLGKTTTLRIGFVDSTIPRLLPQLLIGYRQRRSDVTFHLEEATTADQLNALRDERLDLGLLVLPVGDVPSHITVEPILQGHMLLALPASHRLAKRRRIRLNELVEEHWITFPSHYGPGMHSLILKSCAAAGFSPQVVQHVRQMHTTAGLVAGGIGVALMPNLFLGTSMPRGMLFVHLAGEGAPIPYELAMAYRKADVPDDFLATARAVAQEVGRELSRRPHSGG
ncbi:LysR family transcriptional regulator [Sodalis sp. RH15]|uniref:LysR family transcriptional regulator n=1 Tax=Sodalis sp. RH15 TaxID=3394330 RepID=UPI0039B3E84D